MKTIAAISTAQAAGGIGIVRISGEDAVKIADAVFDGVSGESLISSGGYRAHYGHIKDEQGVIDEGVALVFRKPKSYTGEDVVEISCHGGIYITRRVLRAVLSSGAELAGAGEFTRRAFINGKMSLTSAEAVMDLIGAQSAQAARCALAGREGALQEKIVQIRSDLTDLCSHLSAWADFPEEEVEEVSSEELITGFTSAIDEISKLIEQFEAGKAVREGVDTVILGRPNVGKSTLMNLLAGCERSIVTDVAGTTRDVVEETVRVGDVILRLADTAGLRETNDPIEQIGVERAKKRMQSAGLILAVFDASRELDAEDESLVDQAKGRAAVAIINKTDLPQKIDEQYIKAGFKHIVYTSAAKKQGIDELASAISEELGTSALNPDDGILYTERQRAAATKAKQSLEEARDAVICGVTFDAVTVLAQTAVEALFELTGELASEEIVDAVFERFCVGK